ncbi:MAG: T9SS type A sorting domain-containing protein [Ignavibacteria bacterium]
MKQLLICCFLFVSLNLYAQNEPWKRPLKICSSIDGVSWTGVQTFQDSSGVPCVIKLPSGILISAFQWFRQPAGSLTWDRVAVKFSGDNGISWTIPQPIVVNGLPVNFARPFDPTLTITDSNRIRIYFSSGLNMVLDTSINTYSAISDDGINYTMDPGFRFSLSDRLVVDPALIKFRGQWHLVNPVTTGGTGAYHNVSPDGMNFTRVVDIVSDPSHQWIGNFIEMDTNVLRFYGSGMSIWYSSSPNGGMWSSFTNTNITGGDPSVVKISGGNYLMVYTGPPYPTSVNEDLTEPSDFKLYQNFPNPFNPVTIINYELRIANFVTLSVYDLNGKHLKTLVNQKQNAGKYELEFNGGSLPSGIYVYKLSSDNISEVRKMMLIR